MNVCVVGLGKIGLPLAVQIASRGHQVTGADIDPDVVRRVADGQAPFPGEAELPERLASVVGPGRLTATTSTADAARSAEVVIIVVPLVIDGSGTPQFEAMDSATKSVAEAVAPGTLVSYETTLPVGTTRERFAGELQEISGLTVGENLFVCHSPERVFSGRVFQDLRRYPKLVGGVDDESARRAVAFYESAIEFDPRPDLSRPNGVWNLGSAEAAELAKLAETTYRDLNIAFANELAVFCESSGVDVGAVIDAANSQPFSHLHRPGVAVGGHCIPVYPHFLLAGAPGMQLPRVARRINSGMPEHVVDRLGTELGDIEGRTVAVLGVSYRGGVKEAAFSGVFPLVELLRARGARPVVHDPLYSDAELGALGFEPFHLGERCDAAVLQADHNEYLRLCPADVPGAQVIVDGRGNLDDKAFNGSSTRYLRIGRSN